MSISKYARAFSALAAMLSLAIASHDARAALIQFEPAPTTAFIVGDSFSLTLRGSDFGSTLDGGGINLGFDPTVLRVASVTVDTTIWEFFSSNGAIDNAAGTVDEVWFASFEERVGSFSIALFTFEALAAGSSALMLSGSTLNPFASGGEPLPVDFAALAVQVVADPGPTPVPSPSTLLLMLCGLPLLYRMHRPHRGG